MAGWTDSRIKAELGARFTSTRHAIHARSPLLRAALRKLARTCRVNLMEAVERCRRVFR